jgi:hypothetical protein
MMKKRWGLTVVLGLLCLSGLLSGCGKTPIPEDIVLKQSADGGSVELVPGQALTLHLKGELTGYSWKVTEIDEQVIEQRGIPDWENYRLQIVALDFRAVGAGQTPLRVEWHRIGSSEISTFTVQVTVRE